MSSPPSSAAPSCGSSSSSRNCRSTAGTPTTATVPPLFAIAIAWSVVDCSATQSNTTSALSPSAARTSSADGPTAASAPNSSARSRFAADRAVATTRRAPVALAAARMSSPIVPAPRIATARSRSTWQQAGYHLLVAPALAAAAALAFLLWLGGAAYTLLYAWAWARTPGTILHRGQSFSPMLHGVPALGRRALAGCRGEAPVV